MKTRNQIGVKLIAVAVLLGGASGVSAEEAPVFKTRLVKIQQAMGLLRALWAAFLTQVKDFRCEAVRYLWEIPHPRQQQKTRAGAYRPRDSSFGSPGTGSCEFMFC